MKKITLISILLICFSFAYSQGVKTSNLPAATTLTGSELIPVVQQGTTKKATAQQIARSNADTISCVGFYNLVKDTSGNNKPVGTYITPYQLKYKVIPDIQSRYLKLTGSGYDDKAVWIDYGAGAPSASTLTDGRLTLQMCTFKDTCTATGVIWMNGVAGSYTGDNTNNLSLWKWNGSTSWVKIAESTNDAALWTATANTKVTTAFTTPVIVYSNQIYALGYIYNQSAQTTAPQPFCKTAPTSMFSEFNGSSTARLCSYIASANTNSPILNSGMTRGVAYLFCRIY